MVHEGSMRYYISTQEEKGELKVTSDDQKYTLTIVTPWVYITDKTFRAKNTLNYEGLYSNDHNLKYRTE